MSSCRITCTCSVPLALRLQRLRRGSSTGNQGSRDCTAFRNIDGKRACSTIVYDTKRGIWRNGGTFEITRSGVDLWQTRTSGHTRGASTICSGARDVGRREPRPTGGRLGGSLALPEEGSAGASPYRRKARREPRPTGGGLGGSLALPGRRRDSILCGDELAGRGKVSSDHSGPPPKYRPS